MAMPNFLIIGAAKAGTSSLYDYLKQHPQIYMSPVKEPRFFAPELYTEYCKDPYRDPTNKHRTSPMDLDEYCVLFKEVSKEIAVGEASTEYLYMPKTPERIKQYIPDVKLIAMLRDPVERAFSSFCYQLRDGCEKLTFEQALQEEEKRIMEKKWWPGWHYKKVGFYYAQVKRYFDTFEREQIKIYLYEDFESNSIKVIQDIFRFLNVDDTFIPSLTRVNASGTPKSKILQHLLTRDNPLKAVLKPLFPKQLRGKVAQGIQKQNLGPKPILLPEIRQELVQSYREDILKLQDLIQRDFTKWLS